MKAKPISTMLERLELHMSPEPTSGCWLWTGATLRGYGLMRIKGKNLYAHRAMYEATVGPIPNGLSLDHLCRVRCCINPAHLEPVTNQENILRGENRNRQKTHCSKGHEFTPENTYNGPKGRTCRACNLFYTRQRRHNQ